MRQIRQKIDCHIHANQTIIVSPSEKYLFIIDQPVSSLVYEINDEGYFAFYTENDELLQARRYEIADSKDTHALLHWKRNQNTFSYVNSVTETEWQIAAAQLEGQPPGTKLSCYKKIPRPYYDSCSKATLFLPCDFILLFSGDSPIVLAVDPISKQVVSPNTPEARSISPEYWAFAKEKFKKEPTLFKIKAHYNVYRDDLPIFHYFIVLNLATGRTPEGVLQFTCQIVAQSRLNKMRGSFGSITKSITQEGKPLAVKKIKNERYSFSRRKMVPMGSSLEEVISYDTGLFLGTVVLPRFNLFCMPLYQKDFSSFCHFLKGITQTIFQKRVVLTTIMLEVVLQLKALHAKHYFHMDLKEQNIVVSFNDLLKPEAKIIDHGLSQRTNQAGEYIGDLMGTLKYFAPELIKAHSRPKEKVTYTAGVDYYALGVIFRNIRILFQLGENDFYNKIIDGLTQEKPEHRLPLNYVQFFLMCDLADLKSRNYHRNLANESCGIETVHGSMTLLEIFSQLKEEVICNIPQDRWIEKIGKIEANVQSEDPDLSKFTFYYLCGLPAQLKKEIVVGNKRETINQYFQFYFERERYGYSETSARFSDIFSNHWLQTSFANSLRDYLEAQHHLVRHHLECGNLSSYVCFFEKYHYERTWADRFKNDILLLLKAEKLTDESREVVTKNLDELLPLLEVKDGVYGWEVLTPRSMV